MKSRKVKTICFILPTHLSYRTGGAELQVSYLVKQLQLRKRYRIYYLCTNSKVNVGESMYEIRPVSVNSFVSKYTTLFNHFALKKQLMRIKPDLIYVRVGSSYCGVAARYCEKNQCKAVWHIAHQREIESGENGLSKRMFVDIIERKFLEYGIRNVDYIIGQAEYQRDLLRKFYLRECDVIIPNSHPKPKERIKKRKTPVRVVWIANFKKWKQPEIFVDLAKEFEHENDVKFVMIGRVQNGRRGELGPFVTGSRNLSLLGELSIGEVNKYLAESHVFVNTSLKEGFPNVFIQAWMRQVPVVSLHVDPDNMIRRHRIGFHSKSFEQLVSDVRLLTNNRDLREEVGKRAEEFALKKFSLANFDNLIDFFEMVMK